MQGDIEMAEKGGSTGTRSEPESSKRKIACIVTNVIGWTLVIVFAALFGYYVTHRGTSDDSSLCLTPACVELASSFIKAANESANPCDNFYTFGCGFYEKNTDMPGFQIETSTLGYLDSRNKKILAGQLQNVNTNTAIRPIQQSVSHFQRCVNDTEAEEIGIQSLQTIWGLLDWTSSLTNQPMNNWGSADLDQLAIRLALLTTQGNKQLIYLTIGRNPLDNTEAAVLLQQPESLLHYSSFKYYNASRDYLVQVAGLAGMSKKEIDLAIWVDALIAQDLVDYPENENEVGILNVSQLYSYSPKLPWTTYFRNLLDDDNVGNQSSVLNGRILTVSLDYYGALSSTLASLNKSTIVAYMKATFLFDPKIVVGLSEDIFVAARELNEVITMQPTFPPRDQLCAGFVDELLMWATGRLFVDASFSPMDKATAVSMLNGITAQFRANLDTITWLDSNTRNLAKVKVDAMTQKMGYPDWLLDNQQLINYYDGLDLVDDYQADTVIIRTFTFAKEVSTLYVPWNKPMMWEQYGSLLTVNAFYDPRANEMIFLAGILQPPVFSADYPLAVNYGGIGAIMGHELTHGFDIQGATYDENGNEQTGWTPSVQQAFTEKSECFVEQYGNYSEVIGGIVYPVDGENTITENTADNGGLKTAFAAFHKASQKSHPALPAYSGYSSDQIFFLSWANIWCFSGTDASKLSSMQDVHALNNFRVIGPTSNMVGFASAWNCPRGASNNPVHKCDVW